MFGGCDPPSVNVFHSKIRSEKEEVFLIKNPDVFILYSIRASVSSGTSMSCFCSLKTEYCIFLLTLFTCGKKLNVSISENMQKRRGKRLQRKRAGKEGRGGAVTRSA